jgi:hypothetical protein
MNMENAQRAKQARSKKRLAFPVYIDIRVAFSVSLNCAAAILTVSISTTGCSIEDSRKTIAVMQRAMIIFSFN